MEDALVLEIPKWMLSGGIGVLILVLMEDALVRKQIEVVKGLLPKS